VCRLCDLSLGEAESANGADLPEAVSGDEQDCGVVRGWCRDCDYRGGDVLASVSDVCVEVMESGCGCGVRASQPQDCGCDCGCDDAALHALVNSPSCSARA
jgi:hypothetical protein